MFLSIRNEDDIIETIFYSGVLTSALALILYYSGLKSSDGRLLDLDGLSPNYIAMFLTPVLVLGIFHSFKSKSLIDYLSVMIILLALILTHSRGVIVGLAGGLIMGIFYYFKKIKLKFAPAILALMLAGFFIGGYLVFKPDWSDHARKATSSNVRYYIWSTSLEIAKERPILGVGLGNFQNYFGEKTSTWVNYPEFITPEALTAHDIFLHIFVVMGLIGFLVFIYFLYGSKFYSFHSLPVGIAIFSILFYGLVDTPFFRNDLSTIFWILMAISYKGLKNAKQT
jgi:O-antigen ligase